MGKINVNVKPDQVLVGDLMSIHVPGQVFSSWAKVARIETLADGSITAVTQTGREATFAPSSLVKVRRDGSRLPARFYRDYQRSHSKASDTRGRHDAS